MARRWVWLLVVATAACSAAQALVMQASGVSLVSAPAFRNAFPLVNLATVVGALVGAVILSRHPSHPIGWLFCWGQLGVAAGLLMRAVADATGAEGLEASVGPGGLANLLANMLGAQFALMLLAVLLLLAPDGRLPSPRWRVFLAVLGAAYLLIVIGLMLIYLLGISPAVEIVVVAGQLGGLAGLLASVAALLTRLRRSTGETRQQLRWIAASAALLASAPAIATGLSFAGVASTPLWVLALLHVGYLAVPVATGFAVLRYRLYDIDRLVGGSVVLAVLTVLSAGAYLAVVALIGASVAGAVPRWVSLVVFVTMILAFQAIRGPARALSDRLVYGPQAMSYYALTRFTRQLVSGGSGGPFLAAVARAAGQLVNAQRCTAVLQGQDGSEHRATWEGGSGSATASMEPWVVSVRHHNASIGRLELDVPSLATGVGRRRELLGALAERVAEGFLHLRLELSLRQQALELQELNQTLEESRSRLLAARDIGRRQVADRIHTEVVARLAPIGTTVAKVAARPEREEAPELVESAVASTTEAIDRLRSITSTVYSRRLAEDGPAAALHAESRPGLTVTVRGARRWSRPVESWLFASCSELLRTARGHVSVDLGAEADGAVNVVFTFSEPPAGTTWLVRAREHAEVLGGSIDQCGPQVVLRLPVIDAT